MSKEAMNQAFEVPLVEQLESVPTNARLVIDDADGMGTRYIPVGRMCHDASKALRQAIAEAEKQEPVAWMEGESIYWHEDNGLNEWIRKNGTPLYTHPQQRTWVGLTYEDMVSLQKDLHDSNGEIVLPTTFAKAVEAKLKEKNT